MAVAPPANLLREKDDLMLPVSPTLAIYTMVLRHRSFCDGIEPATDYNASIYCCLALCPALRKNLFLKPSSCLASCLLGIDLRMNPYLSVFVSFISLSSFRPSSLSSTSLLDILPGSPLLGWSDGQALLRKNQALLSRRIYKYHKKIFSGGAIWLYNSQPSRN